MVVLEVAQDILNVGSVAYKIDMTALTLKQIKDTVERIEKKVDKLLNAPLETAETHFKNAITEIINDFYEKAFGTLDKVIDNAITGLSHFKGTNISLESFEEYIKAARLIAFSTVLLHSYENEKKVFLPYFLLSSRVQNVISDKLEDVVKDCLDQKENVNVKTLRIFEDKGKKSIVQDMLDSLLKVAYPYISQAKNLTDMRADLSSTNKQIKLMPKYLPEGYEDKTELVIGFTSGNSGPDLAKVNAWKSGNIAWLQKDNDVIMFYKPIPKCETMDMEGAESGHPGPFTLSSTGLAGKIWPLALGDFSLSVLSYNDRPVYSNNREKPDERRFLYNMESGCWGVAGTVGHKQPVFRSTTAATSPTLCQQWESREFNGSKFKPDDITLIVKN